MSFHEIFQNRSPEILSKAVRALNAARLRNYAAQESDTIRICMRSLLDTAEKSIRERNGLPIIEYAESLARKRHREGYALYEVQTAFNSLEEALWEQMMSDVEPTEFLPAMGMISSVIGMGKDAVARTYLEMSGDSVILAGESWEISKDPARSSVLTRVRPRGESQKVDS